MKKNPTWQKTVSWLCVSGVLIALTAWFESGSLMVGLMTAFWASLIKTPVYSLHESLWGKIIFKDKPKETHNVITFECSVCAEKLQEAVEAA